MSESKSLLARLLAKENITVQHGNYQTAYFNVQDRVLGLPLWKDDDKDLYDMLVGHEVGHALFTPAEGWIDMQKAAKDERVPGDYLNVVEDIRIERKVQGQYPGIVRSFKNGYHYLSKSDFFGLEGRDPNEMGLMDRINLKAKLRDLVQINFSEAEMPLVKKAFEAETWDEVVEAARALYNYVRQSQDSTETQTTRDPNANSADSEDPTAGNETDEEETSDDQETDTDSEETGGEDQDSTSDQTAESSDNETESQDKEGSDEVNEVETYQNALKNQHDLLEKNEDGAVPTVIHGLSRDQMDRITIPFSDIRDARFKAREDHIARVNKMYQSASNPSEQWLQDRYDEMNTDESYKEFIAETKRVVNMMAKEFELRKAAYQYSRASTSRSGALNMDKLHEYKINDDIFRRVTKLADSKSHGMVMLIDNSASMHNERGAVITQVLNMAMFCKRVNIPFDVYSFTNRSYRNAGSMEQREEAYNALPPEGIDHTDLLLTHILSSSFSSYDYDTAYRQLYDLSRGTHGADGIYDGMSGTPLNDILTGMHMKLKAFKQKHQVQKVIFTVLTDGDSNALDAVSRPIPFSSGRSSIRVLLSESRQMVSIRNIYDSVRVTERLLDSTRKEIPGLVNVGYFVANNGMDFSTAVNRASDDKSFNSVREARKIANKNKFVSYDSTIGYDRYFILKADKANLEATSDNFEIPTAAKRNEITRAFKKYAKSKKGNRVLATQFAEIVS
jgi:hypothetical protein